MHIFCDSSMVLVKNIVYISKLTKKSRHQVDLYEYYIFIDGMVEHYKSIERPVLNTKDLEFVINYHDLCDKFMKVNKF